MRTVAEFAIGYEQLLDASGTPIDALPAFASDPAELIAMYRMMVLCRLFDTKAINLQRTGKLGTYAPCTGHEATHVGVGAAMRAEDVLVPVYREYGTQLWRGVTMDRDLHVLGRRRTRQRLRQHAPGFSLVRAHRFAEPACRRHRHGVQGAWREALRRVLHR
ncbi:MAG: thiamine pyrophosphate-dependent enzyme [Pseudomonadota bacterium]